jgi:hypothetical protein
MGLYSIVHEEHCHRPVFKQESPPHHYLFYFCDNTKAAVEKNGGKEHSNKDLGNTAGKRSTPDSPPPSSTPTPYNTSPLSPSHTQQARVPLQIALQTRTG